MPAALAIAGDPAVIRSCRREKGLQGCKASVDVATKVTAYVNFYSKVIVRFEVLKSAGNEVVDVLGESVRGGWKGGFGAEEGGYAMGGGEAEVGGFVVR